MKYFALALFSFLVVVAQMIAGENSFIFNSLDLPLILVAYWVTYRSRTEALFVGSLTGLFLDAAMGLPLGYNGFGKTLAAFIMGQCWQRFNTRESWVQFVIMAVSSLTGSISILTLSWIMQRAFIGVYLGSSIIQALVTAFITIILFAVLGSYRHKQAKKAH